MRLLRIAPVLAVALAWSAPASAQPVFAPSGLLRVETDCSSAAHNCSSVGMVCLDNQGPGPRYLQCDPSLDGGLGDFTNPVNLGGAGGGAPISASYLTLGLNGVLTAERVFTCDPTLSCADTGANGTFTPAINLANANTWSATQTFNVPSTPAAIIVDHPASASPGLSDGNPIQMTGRSDDGTPHRIDWRFFVDVETNAGDSSLHFQQRNDAGSFTQKFAIGDEGIAVLGPRVGAGSQELLRLWHDPVTPAAGDGPRMTFWTDDSLGVSTEYGRAQVTASDVTDGSEDGAFSINLMVAGSSFTTFNVLGASGGNILFGRGTDENRDLTFNRSTLDGTIRYDGTNFDLINGTILEADLLFPTNDGSRHDHSGADVTVGTVDEARLDPNVVLDTETVAGIDSTAIHDNVAAEISALTEKVTPVSGDHLLIEDSAAGNAKKRVQVGNLPTGGGGEANTASNLGSGLANFDTKVGIDLRFNTFRALDFSLASNLLSFNRDATLAGDPALGIRECVWNKNPSWGGGVLCEGSVANEFEQEWAFPLVSDTADATNFFAFGDSSGRATTYAGSGSTTNEVDLGTAEVAGTLPLVRGGTNAGSWTANRCVRVNAGGTALESAPADCGAGGSGDSLEVEAGDNGGTFDAIDTTAQLEDSLDINFERAGAGAPHQVTGTVRAGAITDAKVNASGITTRTKLPSPLAYEDESNAYSGGTVQDFSLAGLKLPITDTALTLQGRVRVASTGTGAHYYDTATRQLAITGSDIANSQAGSCTFAAGVSCAVTLPVTEADASYLVQTSCGGAWVSWVSGKQTTGFTINASTTNSDVCDWRLIR